MVKRQHMQRSESEDSHILEEDIDAAIQEVKDRVSCVHKAESDDSDLRLDVTSLEGRTFSISVSTRGYKIVSPVEEYTMHTAFESLHALLSNVSPRYRDAFGASLANALSNLASLQDQDDDA